MAAGDFKIPWLLLKEPYLLPCRVEFVDRVCQHAKRCISATLWLAFIDPGGRRAPFQRDMIEQSGGNFRLLLRREQLLQRATSLEEVFVTQILTGIERERCGDRLGMPFLFEIIGNIEIRNGGRRVHFRFASSLTTLKETI
jgi:hypothetical protein